MDAAGFSALMGTMYVAIRGDMSQLPGDLADAGNFLKSKFSVASLGSGFLELGKAALAAYAPVALLEKGLETWNENAREGEHLASAFGLAFRQMKTAMETTGNMSSFGADNLKAYALLLDDTMTSSATGIMQFQSQLMQFERVQGDVFMRATRVAVDWAELYGHEIPSKARVLGMALNDPIRGIALLRRANIQLTDAQQEQIKVHVQQNNLLKAQDIILSALEKRYGGAAEKMASPTKKLRSELETLLRKIGDEAKQREPITLKAKIAFAGFQGEFMKEFMKELNVTMGGESKFDYAFFGSRLGGQLGAGAKGAVAGAALGAPFAGVGAVPGAALGFISFSVSKAISDAFDDFIYGDKKQEAERLEKKRIENLARMATQLGTNPYEPIRAGKDKIEGIMDPIQLYNKIQSTLLDKDPVVAAIEAGNQIQEEILGAVSGGVLAHGGGM